MQISRFPCFVRAPNSMSNVGRIVVFVQINNLIYVNSKHIFVSLTVKFKTFMILLKVIFKVWINGVFLLGR